MIVRKNIFLNTIFCVQCVLGVNLGRKKCQKIPSIFWPCPAWEQSFAFSEFHSPSEENSVDAIFNIFQ